MCCKLLTLIFGGDGADEASGDPGLLSGSESGAAEEDVVALSEADDTGSAPSAGAMCWEVGAAWCGARGSSCVERDCCWREEASALSTVDGLDEGGVREASMSPEDHGKAAWPAW